MALIGSRYIGKTSILQQFLSEIIDSHIISIYIDAEYSDTDTFCQKVAGSILYEFSKMRSLPLHGNLNLLIEQTQSLIPKTTASVKKIQKFLRQAKKSEAYQEAIALPQVFSSETAMFCLFVIDEFQCLEEWGVADIFQELGKVIMTQKQCLYVFASSAMREAQVIFSEKLLLLFGNFEMIEITTFDDKTSREYIRQQFSALQIRDDLRDFLIDFTGGHPLYLRLLCKELVDLARAYGQNEIFIPLLSRAVENVLFDSWGVLSRHFDLIMSGLCSGKGNMIYADVLISLSMEKQKIKDLADKISVRQSNLSPKIKRLQEMGLLAKVGRSFYIGDRMMRYWLCYVFHHRRETVGMDFDVLREQFREKFASAVDEFRMQSTKAISTRIIELLRCFDDESFQSGGRQYKLPAFEKVDAHDVCSLPGGRVDVIRASTSAGNDWLIFLKAGDVQEQDLNGMISSVKEGLTKPQRCVLIAFNDLDETARVRALQERMWIWNESDLKKLLNLYNKPYIACV